MCEYYKCILYSPLNISSSYHWHVSRCVYVSGDIHIFRHMVMHAFYFIFCKHYLSVCLPRNYNKFFLSCWGLVFGLTLLCLNLTVHNFFTAFLIPAQNFIVIPKTILLERIKIYLCFCCARPKPMFFSYEKQHCTGKRVNWAKTVAT